MKFAGMVTVTAMGPCPPIQKGQGRVVTMTVTHENSHVFELELSGFDAHGRAVSETLCPTDVHKLYSVERGWTMTKHLRVGEVLRTQTGAATITAIKRKAGDHRVYNFEVEATHAYFVGTTRTLSHNVDCPVTSAAQTHPTINPKAATEGSLTIGRVGDIRKPGGLEPNDYVLNLPNQGSPKANWKQNSSRLREAMGEKPKKGSGYFILAPWH